MADRFVGLTVDLFSSSIHTNDLIIGSLVAPLSGFWRYRFSALTGWTGVSIPFTVIVGSATSVLVCALV